MSAHSLISSRTVGLSNPNALPERDRRSQIGSHKTGRELCLVGFPTAPTGCQAPGDNADALQWATPRSRKAAAQRQGSGDGHSDIKAASALKLVTIGPVRDHAEPSPGAGGRVSGKRLWEIVFYGEADLRSVVAASGGPQAQSGAIGKAEGEACAETKAQAAQVLSDRRMEETSLRRAGEAWRPLRVLRSNSEGRHEDQRRPRPIAQRGMGPTPRPDQPSSPVRLLQSRQGLALGGLAMKGSAGCGVFPQSNPQQEAV